MISVARPPGQAAQLFAPVRTTRGTYTGVEVRADAARHVFEVACLAGLEQSRVRPVRWSWAHVVKQAAAFDDAAQNNGPCGTRLSALLRLALETGKAARDGKSVRAINTLGAALDAVAVATAARMAAAVEDKVWPPC